MLAMVGHCMLAVKQPLMGAVLQAVVRASPLMALARESMVSMSR